MSAVMVHQKSEIDDRLEDWARWYRKASRPPTGGWGNPLAGLRAEGAEIDRGSRSAADAGATIRLVRDSLRGRLRLAQRTMRLHRESMPIDLTLGTPPTTDEGRQAVDDLQFLMDEVSRLKTQLARCPAGINSLPWASLIHGTGLRPDPEFPEEESTELAVAALMPTLRKVVHWEYLRYGTQQMKAEALGYSLATYKRRLTEALRELKYRLTA